MSPQAESTTPDMTLWDIVLSALASSALLAAAVVFGWLLFRSAAVRWVNHQFDERLEKVKAEHGKQQETLKSDLAKQRSQLEALQTGALSGMAARNALLDRRRIEALEKVWGATAHMHAYHNLVVMCALIGFDRLSKVAKDSQQGTAFVDALLKMAPPFADLQKPDNPYYRIDGEQLFLPPLVWAMFDAYRSVIFLPMAMLIAIKGGIDVQGMWDAKRVQSLIKAALPDANFDLDGSRTADLAKIADTLKRRLLEVAVEALEGPASDAKSVERAAEIVRSAQALQVATAAAGNPAVSALTEKQ